MLLLFCSKGIFSFETMLADSIYQKATQFKDERGIEFVLDNYYSLMMQNGNDALELLNAALQNAVILNNKKLIGKCHFSLGMANYMKGNYPQCFEHYQKALDIFEEINDLSLIGRTCNEFSVYWRRQKQFEKGLEYLDRSFKVCKECADTACVETSLNNKAVIYEMMGNYNQAIFYYDQAKKVALSHQNYLGLAYIYVDAAQCYFLMENIDSALVMTEESIKLMESEKNFQGLGLNLINKAKFNVELGKLDEGILIYQQCIELAAKMHYTDLLLQCHFQIGQTFAKKRDFENAVYHIEKSFFLKDSLLNIQKINQLAEMEVKYETEKVEKELLEEQNIRTEAELKAVKFRNGILYTGGFALMLVLLFVIFYQRKLRIAQAEKDKAIILEREKGIVAVFDATEEERKRIAKDLHDGIGQQMSGLKLAWENLVSNEKNVETETKEKIKLLTNILDGAATELRSISHRMMPKVLESVGMVSAIEQMLEKTFQMSGINYQFENLNIQQRFDQRTELVIFRVTQELINNIVKHSQAKNVFVQMLKNKNALILVVEDDGIGFDPKEKSDGLGMLNIKSRLETVKGNISFERGETSGTIAKITIPV